MEGTSLGAEFQHEPLPDSTSHIRLLEILRVDSEDRIVCRLTAWPINDAPKYYALSYTWGESNSSSLVIINEGVFAAGANCIYALQQAYASEASEFFWVDALCIDQKSTQEKNHQVAMMGQIYARAVHVFACVG
ncbi:heterokaryon incompatibility protein-domain-containing protein, partial [Pyrenochaeta sp. MPI-SDFR-AT-0127]